MFDAYLKRADAEQIVRQWGHDRLMGTLERKFAPLDLQLYSVSTGWRTDPGVSVIKARGVNGDLLVKLV